MSCEKGCFFKKLVQEDVLNGLDPDSATTDVMSEAIMGDEATICEVNDCGLTLQALVNYTERRGHASPVGEGILDIVNPNCDLRVKILGEDK